MRILGWVLFATFPEPQSENILKVPIFSSAYLLALKVLQRYNNKTTFSYTCNTLPLLKIIQFQEIRTVLPNLGCVVMFMIVYLSTKSSLLRFLIAYFYEVFILSLYYSFLLNVSLRY